MYEKIKGEKEEEKHHFKMVEVTTGETELGFVAVTLPENFELNTKIVVKGAFSLLAKMKNSEEEGGHAH